MRVLFTAIALILIMASVTGRAAVDSAGELYDDSGQIPGINCYDYYFLGNKGIDTRFFSGTNPNATFFDEADLLYYDGLEECSTYVVSGSTDMNLLAPFLDEKKEIDYSTNSTQLLPNPVVGFVEEESIEFEQHSSRDTVFYGGILPFVALPDGDLATEDSFFNGDSFSLFLYSKRKF